MRTPKASFRGLVFSEPTRQSKLNLVEVTKGLWKAAVSSWRLLFIPPADQVKEGVAVNDRQIKEAIGWNRARHSKEDTIRIQEAVGADADGWWGHETITMIMQWQFDHGLKQDGKVGSETLREMRKEVVDQDVEWRPLTDEEVDHIISMTVEIEAGYTGDPYSAMNLDAEHEGWFDRPRRDASGRKLKPAERAQQPDHKPHAASKYGPHGGIHIGLSWGIIQFTLDGGSLGRVLTRAHTLNPVEFMQPWEGDGPELLEVSNREGTSGLRAKKTRGPRVHPVGGEDLWTGQWPARFKAAAKLECFRRAQRDIARKEYFEPARKIVEGYGLSGQGDLAVAFDMCVQYGAGGARKRFKKAGHGAPIGDVIATIGDRRGRERRHEILAHADVWVHYTELGAK